MEPNVEVGFLGKRMFAGSGESVVILAVFVVCVTRAGHAVRMAFFSLSLARSLSFFLFERHLNNHLNKSVFPYQLIRLGKEDHM